MASKHDIDYFAENVSFDRVKPKQSVKKTGAKSTAKGKKDGKGTKRR